MKNNIIAQEVHDLWGYVFAQGILSILLGLMVLIWPLATVGMILFFIAFYSIFIGIVEFIMGISLIGKGSWFFPLIGGIISILLGIFIFRYPGVSILNLVYLVGGWFIVRGIFDLLAIRGITAYAMSSGWRIFIGIISIILGIMLLNKPVINGYALYIAIGIYCLIVGPIMIGTAISLKRHTISS